MLAMLGFALWVGAGVAYVRAVQSVKIDNVFMSGDQSSAANYAPAIFLGIAGAFVFLVAAIVGSHR